MTLSYRLSYQGYKDNVLTLFILCQVPKTHLISSLEGSKGSGGSKGTGTKWKEMSQEGKLGLLDLLM